ncbi:MAG: sensor histidine kinase [Bacteroidetes bacterium]|nr:sensor histidine kinase [Bacteroidota bacterium]
MNKLSPLLFSILTATLTATVFYFSLFQLLSFSRSSDLLFAGGLVFVLIFVIVYLLTRIYIYSRLKQLYVTIHNYRKTDIDEQEVEKIEFSNDVIEDIDKEVNVWAEERKTEIDRLKKLETYRKEYLGNVSHELKTPIFNIQGYISTLLDGGLEDKSINRDYLQRAESSVDRMIGIVEDLEAISQLEAGQLELEFEKFDVVALAKEIFRSQEMKATDKGIILSFKDVDEKPVYVLADKFRIRQVLTNLVVNSIKYGKEYGETTLKFSDVGENIRIEISDNGIGISEKHLPRLFERFYRVDKHRSREQGGTGLGLAIVKHILEAHNQMINVMSTEGVGSVFSFTLKKA